MVFQLERLPRQMKCNPTHAKSMTGTRYPALTKLKPSEKMLPPTLTPKLMPSALTSKYRRDKAMSRDRMKEMAIFMSLTLEP